MLRRSNLHKAATSPHSSGGAHIRPHRDRVTLHFSQAFLFLFSHVLLSDRTVVDTVRVYNIHEPAVVCTTHGNEKMTYLLLRDATVLIIFAEAS